MLFLVATALLCLALAACIVIINTQDIPFDAPLGASRGLGPGGAVPSGAIVARSLRDFRSVDNSLVFPRGAAPEIQNITDEGNGMFRFFLRHRGAWYDGDRDLRWNDRGHDKSRAEVSGLKGLVQRQGETWEYGTTFKVDTKFMPSAGYCDVMQQHALSWVGLTQIKGDVITGGLYYTRDLFKTNFRARQFSFRRGEWVTLVVRLRVHPTNGECVMSVNGDEFQGHRGKIYKPDRDFGGKWGIYGSGTKDVTRKPLGDSLVWHKNIWMRKVM
jgi:hypothetical protein